MHVTPARSTLPVCATVANSISVCLFTQRSANVATHHLVTNTMAAATRSRYESHGKVRRMGRPASSRHHTLPRRARCSRAASRTRSSSSCRKHRTRGAAREGLCARAGEALARSIQMCAGVLGSRSAPHYRSDDGRGCSSSVVSERGHLSAPQIDTPHTHSRREGRKWSRAHRAKPVPPSTTRRPDRARGPRSTPATLARPRVGSTHPRCCPLQHSKWTCHCSQGWHKEWSCIERRRSAAERSQHRHTRLCSFPSCRPRVVANCSVGLAVERQMLMHEIVDTACSGNARADLRSAYERARCAQPDRTDTVAGSRTRPAAPPQWRWARPAASGRMTARSREHIKTHLLFVLSLNTISNSPRHTERRRCE